MIIPILNDAYTEERCVQKARETMAARGWNVVGDPVVQKVPSNWWDGPRFEWHIWWDDPKPAADDHSNSASIEPD